MSFVFRKPLGLALSGGSALGAWQAGCLAALDRSGIAFDRVFGFSAGAICGASYFVGLQQEIPDLWRDVGRRRVLRLAPRLMPPSLFSDAALWEAVRVLGSEESARRNGRCELTIATLRLEDHIPIYSRFTPRGENGWDGPLQERLVASCSIPRIFPSVSILENGIMHHYADGGALGKELLNFESLKGCADVIALEMVRPEERGRRRWTPLWRLDQRLRDLALTQMDAGVESLLRLPRPPRLFRLPPSRILGYLKFSYRSEHCSAAVDQGLEDGESFLDKPENFRYFNARDCLGRYEDPRG